MTRTCKTTEVIDLPPGGLTFTPNRTSASFRIRVNPDSDVEDETIGLSFGILPAGVRGRGRRRRRR